MHPYRDSTVAYSLGIVGFGLPMVLIVVTEFLRWKLKPSSSDKQSFKLFNCELPSWLIDVYKNFGVFLFGAFVTILATDIGKRTIGRLRPHFMQVCRPVRFDGTNCSVPANFNRYIEDYTCSNRASTEEQLRDMKLSFPSGHSSFSMYAMFFAAMYLHFTMTWKGSKLLKYLLQFIFVMMAWFTALSRVSDYKHHCKCLTSLSYLISRAVCISGSDVLAGSALGISIAFFVVLSMTDLQKRSNLSKSRNKVLSVNSNTDN